MLFKKMVILNVPDSLRRGKRETFVMCPSRLIHMRKAQIRDNPQFILKSKHN